MPAECFHLYSPCLKSEEVEAIIVPDMGDADFPKSCMKQDDEDRNRLAGILIANKSRMDGSISRLEAYDQEEEHWRVVIETPKGSHNKYKFDPKLGLFILNGVLPEGMSFPYDFGFLPGTLGDDGDPLDVLLLMDEPAFCGCIVPARLIGVIEAQQTEEDGSSERNDRLVAIPVKARDFSDCKNVKDLNEHRINEVEQFFVTYNRLHDKRFKLLGLHGPSKAESLAQAGIKLNSKGAQKRGKQKDSKRRKGR